MTGIAAALADVAMGPLSAPDQGGEQADLWADGEGVGAGPLDDQADAPISQLGRDLYGKPRRGGGRPKGAQNRSTEAWRAYFLAQRRDPALVLADIYSMPVEELAMRLGCPNDEALKLQLRAAEILMPYLHAKQPLAIKTDGLNLPTLHLHMPMAMTQAAAPANDGAAGGVVDLFAHEFQQNQGISALPADADGKAQVVGGEIAQQDQGVSGIRRETSNPTGGADGLASGPEASRKGGVTRDTGGDPPTDIPPVSPLPDQRDDTV